MQDDKERKYAQITGSTNPVTVVSAVAGKRIRVLAYHVTAGAAGSLVWQTNTLDPGPVALNGAGVQFAARGSFGMESRDGLFQTAKSEDLILGNAGGIATGGAVTYILV